MVSKLQMERKCRANRHAAAQRIGGTSETAAHHMRWCCAHLDPSRDPLLRAPPHTDTGPAPQCVPKDLSRVGPAPPRCPSCLEISADNTMNTKTDLPTRRIEAGRVGRVLGVLQTLC